MLTPKPIFSKLPKVSFRKFCYARRVETLKNIELSDLADRKHFPNHYTSLKYLTNSIIRI